MGYALICIVSSIQIIYLFHINYFNSLLKAESTLNYSKLEIQTELFKHAVIMIKLLITNQPSFDLIKFINNDIIKCDH